MDTPFRLDIEELKERLQLFKINPPSDEIINNFVAVEEALKAEVTDLFESIAIADLEGGLQVHLDQVSRIKARMLIRSIFASIEGIVYGMKQLALAAFRPDGPLTFDELIICKGISLRLKNNGDVDRSAMRLEFGPNLKFSFMVLAKAFHQKFELDTDKTCLGWNRLVESVKVRNRLAHPKRPSDLELTDEEIGHAIEAYQWFNEQVSTLLEMFSKDIEKTGNYLDNMLQVMRSNRANNKRG